MSAKRLAVLVVPVLVLVTSALAQDFSNATGKNEGSFTGGRTFVSTQTVQSTSLPIHFGNEESVAANYARLLKSHKIFGL